MEIALIGVPLIGGALWLKYPVTRERIYHCIGAWAWACRDAEALIAFFAAIVAVVTGRYPWDRR